ncbi:TIGR03621 family F420-dependent LLM class oxidoreductase [Kribbella sp. NPDC050124]|uniref:TIGR03621 family F420-dependent LLM class oxidoreductase n=1 Tax=Kribbella sp. NPDC050124 TaxID=3364114 RepID=UPI00379C68AB
MRDFRFGCSVLGLRSRKDFVEQCRAAERYGYDVVVAADHLGMPAPFPVLTAAADATTRLRVGTFVLNAGLWNPHVLAREVATVDRLTGGRLEVGLGTGYVKWENDAAAIGWGGQAARVDRLHATVDKLTELFAAPGYEEQRPLRDMFDLPVLAPTQSRGFGGYGPPLLVGGTGDAVLELAAQRADIVSIAGTYQIKGMPPGTVRLGTAREAEERVQFVRRAAGARFADIELNTIVQLVIVTDDRRAAAEKLIATQLPTLSVDEALATPHLLIGTVDEIAGQLKARREQYGFSYFTVQEPFLPVLAPVIERLRA